MVKKNPASITIDGVQINADELSDKAKAIVHRLHGLNEERNELVRTAQEKEIIITAYRNQLVLDYQKDQVAEEKEEENKSVKKSNN